MGVNFHLVDRTLEDVEGWDATANAGARDLIRRRNNCSLFVTNVQIVVNPPLSDPVRYYLPTT